LRINVSYVKIISHNYISENCKIYSIFFGCQTDFIFFSESIMFNRIIMFHF
jgi:hypothetical protein